MTASLEEFKTQLEKHLDIGDRQIALGFGARLGPESSNDPIYITFVNMPSGVEGGGGGADRMNNRALLVVKPVAGGKLKLEQLDRSFFEKLKGKTGTPAAIAKYAADYLNACSYAEPRGGFVKRLKANSSAIKPLMTEANVLAAIKALQDPYIDDGRVDLSDLKDQLSGTFDALEYALLKLEESKQIEFTNNRLMVYTR